MDMDNEDRPLTAEERREALPAWGRDLFDKHVGPMIDELTGIADDEEVIEPKAAVLELVESACWLECRRQALESSPRLPGVSVEWRARELKQCAQQVTQRLEEAEILHRRDIELRRTVLEVDIYELRTADNPFMVPGRVAPPRIGKSGVPA